MFLGRCLGAEIRRSLKPRGIRSFRVLGAWDGNYLQRLAAMALWSERVCVGLCGRKQKRFNGNCPTFVRSFCMKFRGKVRPDTVSVVDR
jgi:hypothetical protein